MIVTTEAQKKRLSRYQQSNLKIQGKIDSLVARDKISMEILNAISRGDNKYLRSQRIESSNYDPKWLQMIEDCIPELGEIIKNPRKVTKTVTDIVPVELAKKTNAESVRHLASHTQYVKSIDENGNVIPNKILNIGTDDDYLTYENKFIATLVKRLVTFVEKRYEFMTKFVPLKETDVMMHKCRAIVDGAIVEIETKVKITKSADEDTKGESSTAYIKRIEKVRQYLLYYMGTDFMKMFKNEREITGQIIQTNIIRKNVKYHKCYELYRYINGYNQLGIDYKVKEEYIGYNPIQMRAVDSVALAAFLVTETGEPSDIALETEKSYKPKILKSMDDDPFVYGPLVRKQILYVRADDEYFNDQAKTIGEVKARPTKEEAEFQKEDAKKKKELDAEKRRVNALKKRREKEAKEFEKKQEALKEAERKRIAAEKAAEEERKKKEEAEMLEQARKNLKQNALEDRKEEEEVLKKEKLEQKRLEEEQKAKQAKEEAPVEEPKPEEKPGE